MAVVLIRYVICLTKILYSNIIYTMGKIKKIKIHPCIQIVLGFIGAILIGGFLLCLPFSNNSGNWLNFLDSLFTSTSAVCVTGLIVVETAVQFTLFGQIVILLLIQIGGIGIVALTTLFFLLLKKKISLSGRLALKESLNKETIQGVVKFIKKVLIITFSIELIGAILLLYPMITYANSFWKGFYYAIFMSISSFCNAGFDVLGSVGNEFNSLSGFASSVTTLLPIMMLIVLGGIGFIVIADGFTKIKTKQHSRVVIIMTLVLIVFGAISFAVLEWRNPNTIGNMSVGDKILNSFFQSISPRTAGIATLDQGLLTSGSVALTIFLMFVGGAPNSTAGGIKITTLFIIMLFTFKQTNEEGNITLKNRRVGRKIIMKCFRLVLITLLTVVVGVVFISLFEGDAFDLMSIIFECVSAISTVGLTMGITPFLTVGSKLVLIFLMFAGRVGILTILMAISSKKEECQSVVIEYANTDIMVG